jgi:DNA-binding transcriptional regulator YhcF (GntR family)
MKEITKAAIVFSAIKEKIDKGELVSGDRLSSLRALAGEFSVSPFTILKAFELLEHENLIQRIQKSGVFIGTKNKNEPVSCKKIPAKTRAREIAESIISEIIQGFVKAGEYLPLKKVLAFKYATSPRTINKAIEILLDRKYIHKDGFHFRIGLSASSALRTAKNRVYILAYQYTDPWDISLLQSLECELQVHGITSFEIVKSWNESDLVDKINLDTTAGFLMVFANLINADSKQLKELFTLLYKTAEVIGKKHLPVVVECSYSSILSLIPDLALKFLPNLFFIGYDHFKAGEKAGAYLASKGHKQIAYFNFGTSPWNQERLSGIESEIKRRFGGESHVYDFQEKSVEAYWTADFSTYKSTPNKDKNDFRESYSKLFKGYQFHMSDPVEGVYPFLADQLYKDIYKKRLAPLFEKALEMKEITAWVGTGNVETFAAAEFLKEHGVDIPDKISLIGFIGFDPNRVSMKYGITTYDIMDNKAGYLAAHCILGDIPVKKNRKGYVEYEGQMMVRKSVKAI